MAIGITMPIRLQANDISVTIDGVQVNFADQLPVIMNGRTLVPVRGVFETLGFEVDWYQPTQTATLTSPYYEVIISIGNANFTTNGQNHALDVPAQIIGSRTMMPLRALLESVGHDVDWNQATMTVIVETASIATATPMSLLVATPVATPTQQANPRYAPFLYTTSAITLPNRQLTDSEMTAWVAEYWEMGGASAFELEVVRLVNEERSTRGLSVLEIDYMFMMPARFYAQTLANLNLPLGHHEGPYGGSGNTVTAFGANRQGHRNGSAGNWTPQNLVDGWMASPGHRSNILVSGHTRVGIGSQLGGQWGVFHYMVLSSGNVQMSGPGDGATPTPTPTPTVPVTGVTISGASTRDITVGQNLQLSANVAPVNATIREVTWSSSNNNVATITSEGNVHAVGAGTATITVRTADGNRTASVTVRVSVGTQQVQVANVVGQTRANAESTLRNQGFTVTVNEQRHDTVASGNVISQNPAAGTLRNHGTAVTITVSTGRQQVQVPNVINMTRSAAETAIRNAGLAPSVTEENHATIASGQVIKQNPTANTNVNHGSTVNVTVSSGRQQVTIPQPNTNETGEAYANRLRGLGFVVNIVEEHHNTIAVGRVIGSSPAAGTTHAHGSTIVVTVSSGVQGIPPSIEQRNPIPGGYVYYIGVEVSVRADQLVHVISGTRPISWSVSGLPDGLRFDTSTYQITGVPTSLGAFDLTFRASNSSGSDEVLTRFFIRMPMILTTSLPSGTVGAAYNATIDVYRGNLDGRAVTWNIHSGSLPDGLRLDPSAGTITGVPTATGTFSFEVHARHPTAQDLQRLTITIN